MTVTLSHKQKRKGQDLWEGKRNNEKQKPVSERRKDRIYHSEKRTKRRERKWRNVIKLGSKLGDWEDIQRRKELATVALAKNDIWKEN